MTIKEAIEYAETAPYCTGCADGAEEKYGENCRSCPHKNFFRKAIEALEKQVPKCSTHDGIRRTCPNCNAPLPNVAHNNCMYCGQAIKY